MTTYTDLERVGFLVIPYEVVATEELRRLLPDDVPSYHHRVEFTEVDTPENRAAALRAMVNAVAMLRRIRPKAIVFACTSGGSFAGPAWHEELLAAVREEFPDIPFATAADAVARTLGDRKLTRVAMGTPYSAEIVSGLTAILESRGITVLRSLSLFPQGSPSDPWDLMTTTPERMLEFAKEVDTPDADCVFLSCTGLHSTPVIEEIEREIGKPLVTSNIAIANVVLEELGGDRSMVGLGSVLAREATG